jgi:hypothetical protein
LLASGNSNSPGGIGKRRHFSLRGTEFGLTVTQSTAVRGDSLCYLASLLPW